MEVPIPQWHQDRQEEGPLKPKEKFFRKEGPQEQGWLDDPLPPTDQRNMDGGP